MTIVLYILSFAVLLFGAYVAAMNWGCAIVSSMNRRRGIDRYHSTVPLVSVILVAFALLLYPGPHKPVWMVAIPLLDIGNWALLVGVLWLPVVSVRERKLSKSSQAMQPEGRTNGEQ
jgi:hypothetical protein